MSNFNNSQDPFGFDDNQNQVFKEFNIQQKSKQNKWLIVLVVASILISMVGAMVIGVFIGANSSDISSEMPLLEEVYSYISQYYYKDINWSEFQNIAASVFAGSIDPFTGIMVGNSTTASYRMGIDVYSNVYNEHFIGFIHSGYNVMNAKSGLYNDITNNFVESNSPKYIDIGDKIYAVGLSPDGSDAIRVENAPRSLISSIINLSQDGKIYLEITKEDDSSGVYAFYFDMTPTSDMQETFAYYYPESVIGNNTAMIKYTSFDDYSCDDFARCVQEFLDDEGKPSKLILDLRHNGGGDSRVLGFVANYLINRESNQTQDLPIAKYVYNSGNGIKKEKFFSTQSSYIDPETQMEFNSYYIGKFVQDFEVAVLCDNDSASSSEALIGALQYYNNSQIIGSKTYGKGVAQSKIKLSNGQFLYVTNGFYYIPTSKDNNLVWEENIHSKGFTPREENIVNSNPKKLSIDPYILRAKEILNQ